MMIHIHVNHKTPLLLRQNPEWRLCQPPLAPTVAIPVASLPGSSWVVSPVFLFFPPSLPVCCLWLFGLFWFVWFSFLIGFVLLFYWVAPPGWVRVARVLDAYPVSKTLPPFTNLSHSWRNP